jgi:hypothetical protein
MHAPVDDYLYSAFPQLDEKVRLSILWGKSVGFSDLIQTFSHLSKLAIAKNSRGMTIELKLQQIRKGVF